MKRLKNLLLCLPVVLGALLCAPPLQAQQTNLIDNIKAKGKLQVGFGSFVPWAMRDKQGQWVGFEVDVATKVAKDLGVAVELVPTAWDAIIPSLIAGKYDVIIGGLSITPQRQEQIDFTAAYSTSGQGIAASKKLAAKLKWPDDYNSASVTFACRRGVAGCKTIEEKFPKASLRQFDDDAIAFQEVINGNAHAVISSEPKPAYTILKNPDSLFNPVGDYITTSSEGFGLRKGNAAAITYFNNWISQNKAWLAQRHSYWFKTQDWSTLVP